MAANPRGVGYLARSSGATVALLRRLAGSTRPAVVWAQWSGYLRKGGPVPKFCTEQGIAPVVIHSGGHAHPEDLADLVRRMRPRAVVPIHTQSASQYATFLPNVRMVADGESVQVASLISEGNREIAHS